MKHDDTNPFKLEDLVIPETAVDAKAKASLLGGTSSVVAVFLALMFKGFNARCPTFALRPDAFKDIGIDRHAQLYALRDLAKRGLITVAPPRTQETAYRYHHRDAENEGVRPNYRTRIPHNWAIIG